MTKSIDDGDSQNLLFFTYRFFDDHVGLRQLKDIQFFKLISRLQQVLEDSLVISALLFLKKGTSRIAQLFCVPS